jgi:hypothetical protein
MEVEQKNALRAGKDAMWNALYEAGFPRGARNNHRYSILDGSRVDTFYLVETGIFFAYDPALKLVAKGESYDDALIYMVLAREAWSDSSPVGSRPEDADSRVYGQTARASDGRLAVAGRPESKLKGKRRPSREKLKNV